MKLEASLLGRSRKRVTVKQRLRNGNRFAGWRRLRRLRTWSAQGPLRRAARFQTRGYHWCVDWRHHRGRARWRQRRSDPSARSALARETDRTTAGATVLPVSVPPLRSQEVRTIFGRYGQPRYVSTTPTSSLCAVGRHQYL